MSRFRFTGMMAPTFAPMNKDWSLNFKVIPAYAKYLNANGVKGIYVNGTAGEGMSMTVSERKAMHEAWMKCQDLVPTTVMQVGAGCLKDTQELAGHAESLRCSGIAVLPCLYDKPVTAQDLVDYCAEVATAAPKTPLLYYHVPFKTGVNIQMSEFLRLGADQVPTLSGLKFTDQDVSGDGRKCLTVANGCMRAINGFDQQLAEALSVGFDAAINLIINYFPQMTGTIFRLASEGKHEEAKKVHEKVNSLLEVIFKPTGGFSPSILKAAMTMLTGIDVGPARKPVKQLTQEQLQALKDGLTNAGLQLHL